LNSKYWFVAKSPGPGSPVFSCWWLQRHIVGAAAGISACSTPTQYPGRSFGTRLGAATAGQYSESGPPALVMSL
jgi:hypothetical protein